MAYQPDSRLDAVPLVLLEIQLSYKDDMVTSSVELVYLTEGLKLLGEFFRNSHPNGSVPEFLQSLRCHVRTLKPLPASHYSFYPVFKNKVVFRSPCVFLSLYIV
ncbi:hypothetical protein NPIL_488291 [Nephila pilipes]|uniref:Uncharacterized protein n=1 Tax=Nephila pilipes TaxID=299642 RepID=A0A8X6P4X0_NEPPI|nr:hypothetical protein NPIL_488291 [Nephila pilipes]